VLLNPTERVFPEREKYAVPSLILAQELKVVVVLPIFRAHLDAGLVVGWAGFGLGLIAAGLGEGLGADPEPELVPEPGLRTGSPFGSSVPESLATLMEVDPVA